MTDSYLRFPHLHGDLVTFVAEDDVWLAPLDGGRAWRVTADQALVGSPRFSPDGTRLAWTSWRDVEPEVHVAPVDGGQARRLTHWGDVDTEVQGWTPDAHVVATSTTGQPSIRKTWAHAIDPDTGRSRRLPYGPVGGLAFGPDGAVLLLGAFSREPAHWKRYRGGTAGKLWLDADGDGEFARVLPDLAGNLASPLWVGDRIAFLSDHEGVADLYSCRPDGDDLRRHPVDAPDRFYARNATTDGRRVIFHRAGRLWLLDSLDAEPRELDIRLGGPGSARAPHPVPATRGLGGVGPDRTGRGSAIEVRGTVHWVTHRDGPVRALAATPGVRARLPQTLGDHVVWVTDADGEEALEIAPVDGNAPGTTPRRIGAGELGRVLELVAAPDGRRVAVATQDGRLLLVDVESGDLREVARSDEGDPEDLAFSPDSAWLAWSHPGPHPMRNIRMASVTDLSTVDVTPIRFVDSDPVFTVDGKHIAFLSARSFDPVYDVHVFDMAFPNGSRPHLVPLAATTPSPFSPQLRGRPVQDEDDDKDKDKSGDHKDDDAAPRTEVDLDGLAERVVPVPVAAARYYGLRAVKGGLVWLRAPLTGALGEDGDLDDEDPRPVLERYDLTKRKLEQLADGVDQVWTTGDGERLLVRDGRTLRVQQSDRKSDGDSDSGDDVRVDLSRVRVTVDPGAEWRQSFDEAWRLMRDHFWRADMGGVDWSAIRDRYRPLVDMVGSHDELVDLLWELQGELGTSHAYVSPPGRGADAARRIGLLGADLARDEDGSWRITRVLPGESSDPRARSPLRAPGVAVRDGDAILAVDGRPVDQDAGPSPLLAGTADKPVELTVAPAGGGAARSVVVVPLLDDMTLRYHDWVADRRRYTHEASDGRIGYLHVPDMIANGWAQLHRDLRLEVRREALIVDVRENRGGHLSQLVVEKLGREIIGWQVSRDGHRAESYPADAPRGPIVAVANEFSGSDGDIVNAAIKALGIGPVVGVRTWGGVIGIDMRYHLVDGTLVTQPKYATWLRGPGWSVENYGVDPDVEVVMSPQDHAAGRDPQLDTAIRMALEALDRTPAASPPPLPPLEGRP
ncbi:S41 family peptidase [Actinophytocola gossypii]|uniref:Tricorn protease homolog n=1 Tax=Actinophytocola gossypii TaxID=2812003 RepID=A0ABT2J599_9PSEU|nr:PDZ domain-containing protein [Actinophytocola gossypii]MCT2583042.1 PDZ domain-containing protein [Actinophytocola gossypii]